MIVEKNTLVNGIKTKCNLISRNSIPVCLWIWKINQFFGSTQNLLHVIVLNPWFYSREFNKPNYISKSVYNIKLTHYYRVCIIILSITIGYSNNVFYLFGTLIGVIGVKYDKQDRPVSCPAIISNCRRIVQCLEALKLEIFCCLDAVPF